MQRKICKGIMSTPLSICPDILNYFISAQSFYFNKAEYKINGKEEGMRNYDSILSGLNEIL